MEFTNLLFAFLIGFVCVAGFMSFFSSLASNYPTMTANSGYMANLSAEMNETARLMDTQTINATLTQSVDTSNLNLGAIFGYVTGAINALTTLIKTPYIFLRMINAFGTTMGFPLIPDFVLQAIVTAVYLIALIGILFYLLKVR